MLKWNTKKIKRDLVPMIKNGSPLLYGKERENMKRRRKSMIKKVIRNEKRNK